MGDFNSLGEELPFPEDADAQEKVLANLMSEKMTAKLEVQVSGLWLIMH